MFFVQTEKSDELNLRSVYRRASQFSAPFHWLEAGWEHEETVVLIHGILAHSMAFRKVVGRLAERYRVVIADLPAHGRDQTFRCGKLEPQIEGFFTWMHGLIEAVGAPSVHLLGHSLGALATFMAARQPPDSAKIESLTLVSPGVRIDVPRWTARFFDLLPTSLARLSVNSLGLRLYEPIQWRKSRMTSNEMRSYLKPLKERERLEFIIELGVDLVREPDRMHGAMDIDIPTLILWGDRDHLLSVETGRVLHSMIVGSDLRVLDGVGHCPMEDDPGRFLDHVLDFYQTGR
ncbi:MAG: alpha/beta fold hydrolase [Myxococcota bacterium]